MRDWRGACRMEVGGLFPDCERPYHILSVMENMQTAVPIKRYIHKLIRIFPICLYKKSFDFSFKINLCLIDMAMPYL